MGLGGYTEGGVCVPGEPLGRCMPDARAPIVCSHARARPRPPFSPATHPPTPALSMVFI